MAKVAVLGGGIAGLSAGWLLKQRGLDFIVLEKQDFIGGWACSFEWHGYHCDIGAHRLFTDDSELLSQLLGIVPMEVHQRRSQIYLQGLWLQEPLVHTGTGPKSAPSQSVEASRSVFVPPTQYSGRKL